MTTAPFDIIGKRTWWYVLSLVLMIPGVISLIFWGLNVGIDFKGGSLQQISYSGERPAIEDIRSAISSTGATGVSVQSSGSNGVIIRFANEDGKSGREQGDKIISALKDGDKRQVKEDRFESIGGSIAANTTRNAVWAVILASIALIVYISAVFGSVPAPASSWRFGVSAIAALLHDLLIMIGAFSILGHFYPSIEVDALFITAVLTILGFSVNDTIVVFDRIRENLRRRPDLSFQDVANESLNQTVARSINTSATVLVVLLALLLLGGESIRSFILALTIGVAVGTYSSIFNASPILVSWQNMVERKTGIVTGKKR